MPIRPLVAALAAAAAAVAPLAQGQAQSWPVKPIRLIVPWPTGGGADTLSRLLQPKMQELFGQQVIIVNRGGAAGNIGAEMGAKAPPDGYTMTFAYSGTHAVNPSIYAKMPFRDTDFAPIIRLSSVPQILVVHPSLPAKTAKDVIALAKARPGQLTFGSSGSGAINHLAGEYFRLMSNTSMVHVPYKGGGPAAISLIGGEIIMIFAEPATIVGHVKSGKVRALGATSEKRALAMPDLPTVAESGLPGYEVTSWNGMMFPAKIPDEILRRANGIFNQIITAPDMRAKMIEYGYEPTGGTPDAFAEHIRGEIVKWAKVVKAAGMKVD